MLTRPIEGVSIGVVARCEDNLYVSRLVEHLAVSQLTDVCPHLDGPVDGRADLVTLEVGRVIQYSTTNSYCPSLVTKHYKHQLSVKRES